MSGITEQSSATHSAEPIDKGKGKAIVPVEETEGETSDEEMVYSLALLSSCLRSLYDASRN